MIQLLAAVLAVTGLALLLRSLWLRSGLTPRQTWVTAAAAVLVAVLIALAATGRMHWLVAAGAALLPFGRRALGLLRFAPLLNQLFPGWHQRFRTGGSTGAGGAGSGYATTETAHLRMSLHQATGHIDGEVLSGKMTGTLLSEMELQELLELHGTLPDPDSKRLLETYLDRTFPDWRAGGAGTGNGTAAGSETMNRQRALEVLGLDDSATDQDVIDAHRRLIQKLHPDRGGSTFLAATLNEAKRTLLGD